MCHHRTKVSLENAFKKTVVEIQDELYEARQMMNRIIKGTSLKGMLERQKLEGEIEALEKAEKIALFHLHCRPRRPRPLMRSATPKATAAV
ncbi:MAG: hypothetical protein V1928_04590 [Parcubacteria group bacterium]